jgi:hypothetical protein
VAEERAMTKAGSVRVERKPRVRGTAADIALGPGLHAATIELGAKGAYRVRTAAGERVRAKLAEGVAPALADECRRTRRTVLVTETPNGVVIIGAVQTQPSAESKREKLRLDAKDLELAAERAIVLRVGKAVLVLDESGAIRLAGEGVALRAAKAVKVLAANVELP